MNDSKVLNGENESKVSTSEVATEAAKTVDVAETISTTTVPVSPTIPAETTAPVPTTTTPTTTKEEMAKLTHLNEEFVYELMAIPSLSRYEYRLVTFIMLWAKRNKVEYEFDEYGNLYLTKGTIAEGEYYPCMTAHLDTVQDKHKAYIQAGAELEVLTRVVSGKREIYVDGMGIGGDDKAGVLIALSMFSHVDTLKAAFFLEEEVGCLGSKKLNAEWFKNVGYVLGYDSPELNRAAWACSGTKLFSADFFKTHMQEICKKHGLTKFFSEPFTDVKQIREATNIICMNFGSGYYNGHALNEYCVIEDMDVACRMGHELIEHLGKTRHELEHKAVSYAWTKNDKGVYEKPNEDDEVFLRTLGENTKYGAYNGGAAYGGTRYGGGTAYRGNTPYMGNSRAWDDDDDYGDYGDCYGRNSGVKSVANGTYTPKVDKKAGDVNIETVQYITEKYDNHLDRIEEAVKEQCKKLGIDYKVQFESIFEKTIKF